MARVHLGPVLQSSVIVRRGLPITCQFSGYLSQSGGPRNVTRAFERAISHVMDRLSRDTAIRDRLRESLGRRGVVVCVLSEWVGQILADIERIDAAKTARAPRK